MNNEIKGKIIPIIVQVQNEITKTRKERSLTDLESELLLLVTIFMLAFDFDSNE